MDKAKCCKSLFIDFLFDDSIRDCKFAVTFCRNPKVHGSKHTEILVLDERWKKYNSTISELNLVDFDDLSENVNIYSWRFWLFSISRDVDHSRVKFFFREKFADTQYLHHQVPLVVLFKHNRVSISVLQVFHQDSVSFSLICRVSIKLNDPNSVFNFSRS